MELKVNQAALILETNDEGEISVEVASPDMDGLASGLCQIIARKLINDEAFQQELLTMLEQE